MRKLTIEFKLNEMGREEIKPLFEDIYSYEILETLKIDWEEGICIDLIECILKEDRSIDDIKTLGQYELLSILKSDGNKHTLLVKHIEPEESKDMFKEFDLDLIYTTPTKVSAEKTTCSVIGDNENIKKFIDLIKNQSDEIVNMIFKKAVYQRQDLLSVLTDKQKEIMVAAHKYGYYDYPKKINSKRLAERVKISKTTMVEHLRKAEGRILSEIMAGYT